jgi:hypothetical protein
MADHSLQLGEGIKYATRHHAQFGPESADQQPAAISPRGAKWICRCSLEMFALTGRAERCAEATPTPALGHIADIVMSANVRFAPEAANRKSPHQLSDLDYKF